MSAAARDLGIGQPTVSGRVDQLERHLNAKLLIRNTRKISMTEAGMLFYQRAKHVISAVDEAVSCVVDQTEQPLTGVLRVAGPHGLGEVTLIPVLKKLRAQNPQLEVDLLFNDVVIDPIIEGVDLSLRVGPPGEGNFVARRLGDVDRILVAAPSYLASHAPLNTPEDLAAHPFIRVATQFCDGPLRLTSNLGSTSRPTITVAWRTSHWRAGLALLLDGCGIGVLQAPMCAEAISQRRLVRILPDYSISGFAVHALYPTVRPMPRKLRTTLQLLEAHFQGWPRGHDSTSQPHPLNAPVQAQLDDRGGHSSQGGP